MSNELIFILTVLIYLGSVLVLYKVFGKNGLFAFAIFGTLLGNIAVCKCVDIFGLSTTAGNVLYASTFLVTDILSEKYGRKDASRAVAYSFTIMVLWMLGTQMILLFTPNSNDYISENLAVVFGLVPRITFASLVGFVLSQNIDVFLYHLIWKRTGNTSEKLWLRNNGSTLTSQAIDTVIFTTLAFWGVYPTGVFFSILITTYLFKAVVALMDTPFMYLARAIVPMNEENHNEEKENLTKLGSAHTEYKTDYDPGVLESFGNKHPGNDYFVKFNCPEFTSLCPITGQPDFATIIISYVPDEKLVESKSLKLYLFSFRNHGDFHEDVVNIIMKDLIKLMDPKYIEVWGKFLPRGGLSIDPYCNYGKPGTKWEQVAWDRMRYHDMYPEKVDNR